MITFRVFIIFFGLSSIGHSFANDSLKVILKKEMALAEDYYNKENFSVANSTYLKVLELAESLKDTSCIIKSLFKIGTINTHSQNYDQAIGYFTRALEAATLQENSKRIANCYLALGNVYILQKKFKEALRAINRSLLCSKVAKDSIGIEICINNLGVIHNKLGEVDKAKKEYEMALTLAINRKDSNAIATGFVNVGSCLLRMNKTKNAISYYYRALTLPSVSLHIKQQIYEALSEAYTQAGDFKNALHYYKRHNLLKDTLFSVFTKQKISELNSKYEFEKKQREIVELKSNQQKNLILLSESEAKLNMRTYILIFTIVLIAILILSAALIYFLYRSKEKLNRRLIIQNSEITSQKQEIENNLVYTQKLQDALKHDLKHYMQLALRKQMNPHFIFNSLNSIQSYIIQNDKLSANQYLASFSTLMRRILENSIKEWISIQEELNTLQLYIELEQKRFGGTFSYKLNVNNNLNTELFLIPPLILQPYVENAIWHGLLHKDGERMLKIDVILKEDHVVFRIEDNGIGRTASAKFKKNKSHESMGTRITAHRLSLIGSLNQSGIEVNYEDVKGMNESVDGTAVTIILPLINALSIVQNP